MELDEVKEVAGRYASRYTNRHYPDLPVYTFTVDKLQAAFNEVERRTLEKAAEVCDERASYYDAGDDDRPNSRRAIACGACAAAIRSMKP